MKISNASGSKQESKRGSARRTCMLGMALLFGLCTAAGAQSVTAPPPSSNKQDPAALQRSVEQFLQLQTAGLPGEAQISVSAIDRRLNVADCAAPTVFMPPGSKAWGKTTVGIRCGAPSNWTLYVQASVRVMADYLVSAMSLAQGSVVGPNDLGKIRGDLTSLPPGILTDPQQAIGRSLTLSLPSGAPIRQDLLKSQPVVLQGQSVRVVSIGNGFQVAADGKALTSAMDGQVVQARTNNGQVVSGLARSGGLIEVSY